jgi:hypothetical protein
VQAGVGARVELQDLLGRSGYELGHAKQVKVVDLQTVRASSLRKGFKSQVGIEEA